MNSNGYIMLVGITMLSIGTYLVFGPIITGIGLMVAGVFYIGVALV